jgi:hypothetical protein
MDELKLSKTLRHHTDAVSATALLHGLPISAGKDGCVCVWDAAAPNSPLVVLEAGGPVHALQLQEEKGEEWLLRRDALDVLSFCMVAKLHLRSGRPGQACIPTARREDGWADADSWCA